MNRYRIYAKILGPILPKDKTQYGECFIERMSIAEQKRRKFKPIQPSNSPVPPDGKFYKSYITHHKEIDPRVIKTEYVMHTEITGRDVNYALGVAIPRFEKVTGALAIAASVHYGNKYNRKARYTNYEYQICRIYEIVDNNEVETKQGIFAGGMISLINLPSDNNKSLLDEKLLDRMLKSKDDIFLKALGYLQEGEKGFHNNASLEKITLDFAKSIELILGLFKGTFSKKLKSLAKEFGIDKEDCDEIKKLWKLRGGGDVAHAKRGSKIRFYPPQYPIPSNVDMVYIESSSLAARVLTKYFLFRDSVLSIKLSDDSMDDLDELYDVDNGSLYTIRTLEKNRKRLTLILKAKISIAFGMPVKNIKLYGYQLPYVHFRIKDHLKFNLSKNKITKKKIVIFGNI